MSFTRRCPECSGTMIPGAGSASGTYKCENCGVTVHGKGGTFPNRVKGPAWVMTSDRDGPDIRFYIGSVQIANICLAGKSVVLRFMDNTPGFSTWSSVSDAMKEMRRLLKEPRK